MNIHLSFRKAGISRLVLCVLTFSSFSTLANETALPELFDMSLQDLLNVRIISASVTEVKFIDAPSNVLVITKDMIRRRGYRNLVDVLQDLPGYDFGMYYESGESTSSSVVRGLGEKDGDNPKLLVLVDSVPQNNISLNSVALLSHEQQLHDVERIEIIQGPGSAVYGAQAYAGIIHIITKQKFTGFNGEVLVGENKSREITFHYGEVFQDDVFFSLAMKKFDTDGDEGKGRPDPGGYYHGNQAPEALTQHYDENGNYLENIKNPNAGEMIPDGYSNWFDTLTLRVKLTSPNNEVELFYWDDEHGMSTSLTGFEYYANAPEYLVHRRGYHIYAKNNWNLDEKWSLKSKVTYRETLVMPDTAFSYTYRFDGIPKSASSSSSQLTIEERLDYDYSDQGSLILGYRVMRSSKSEYFYSIGRPQNIDSSIADSSWNIAVAGGGLNQAEPIHQVRVLEHALFGLLNQKWNEQHLSSIGLRYENSEEYGEVYTPRLAHVFKLGDWVLKAMAGTAFRQPTFTELYFDGIGNPNLSPEKVATYELEANLLMTSAHLRVNVFFSEEKDAIELIQNPNPDPNSFSDRTFDNIAGTTQTGGVSILVNYEVGNLNVYSNYIYTQGKRDDHWEDIERVARHKINLGLSWFIHEDWDANIRFNYVSKRRAQESNRWLQTYSDGYAPSYTKTNLAVTYSGFASITPQILVMNLFDKDYYGVGRRSAESFSDDYDPVDNVNPRGFIPAYHPQPGREIHLKISASF